MSIETQLNPAQKTFDRIQQSYLATWCRFHPEVAFDAGVETFSDKLKPHDDEIIGAQIVLNEKCLSALEELSETELDSDRLCDYHVLRGAVSLEHHSLMDHDWRHRDPTQFVPLHAIYQLTLRPIEDFAFCLQQRLAAIPQQLRSARSYLEAAPMVIPSVWLEMALSESTTGVDYLHHLHQHPRVAIAINENDQIEQAIADAAHALEIFSHTLDRDISKHCQGDFACGREHFERLLQQQHFLPINADQLHRFGQQLFSETQQALEKELSTSKITLEDIYQNTPQKENLLDSYRQEIQAAQKFLSKHDLIALPETETLTVTETPVFLRHQIPFAAYMDPASNDPEQHAYYYVTPPVDDESLQEHNFAAISQTSVHEAWPGHHLQFVTANQSENGGSLLRRLNPSATLYEGWALYCEQLMLEQGFKQHPGQKIILLRDRLWRALRITLDVEIHTRGLSLDDAADKMVSAIGFSKQQALAELSWYTQAPTVPMSYAVGWALITTLRDQLGFKDRETLKHFHHHLLESGSIALPLVIQHQFGKEVWDKCYQHVFGVTA